MKSRFIELTLRGSRGTVRIAADKIASIQDCVEGALVSTIEPQGAAYAVTESALTVQTEADAALGHE